MAPSSILLFGSTGNLGKKIALAATQQGYRVVAVVRNKTKGESIKSLVQDYIVADVTSPSSMTGICNGFPIVISALGKSVSPNEKSK